MKSPSDGFLWFWDENSLLQKLLLNLDVHLRIWVYWMIGLKKSQWLCKYHRLSHYHCFWTHSLRFGLNIVPTMYHVRNPGSMIYLTLTLHDILAFRVTLILPIWWYFYPCATVSGLDTIAHEPPPSRLPVLNDYIDKVRTVLLENWHITAFNLNQACSF